MTTGQLRLEESEAVSRTTGEIIRARRAVCAQCGCRTWFVYAIGESNHMHLECRNCRTTYCDDPECSQKSFAQ